MELLLFRTDIKSKEKVKSITSVFNAHTDILKWSIDTEDIDNVLRIEATSNLTEQHILDLVKIQGFCIDILTD